MKVIISLFILMGGLNQALASDSWDRCSNAMGDIVLENGTLYVAGVGEIAEESVQTKLLTTVKNEKEECVLENSNYTVISFLNTVTVEEVTYTIEENTPPTTSVVICERGGSGIPANDNCKE